MGIELGGGPFAPQVQVVGGVFKNRAQPHAQGFDQALAKQRIGQFEDVAKAQVLQIAFFQFSQVFFKIVQLQRLGRQQGKAKLCVQVFKAGPQHGLHLGAGGAHLVAQLAQALEGGGVHLAHAQLQARMLQRLGQLLQLFALRSRAQMLKRLVHQAQMHRAQGQDAGAAGLKAALLLLDALAHAVDHRGVFAAQAVELHHLLIQIAAADLNRPAHLGAHLLHPAGDRREQDRLAVRQDALGQGILKGGQAAFLQQIVALLQLGLQPFLRRQRQDALGRYFQHLGTELALALQLLLHFFCAVDAVPQRINFVQHHQVRFALAVAGQQMLLPNGQVRLGHPGIGPQQKHHGMGLGNLIDGQLWLGPDGVQARGVQNHQPLLEQGMGDVHQRVPPAGNLDQPLRIDHGVVLGQLIVPKAQGTGFLHRNRAGFCHFGDLHRHLLRVVHIQRQLHPGGGAAAPLRQAVGLLARFNGQQPHAGGQGRVIAQFCGAHGGASRRCRHDAPPVMGKKDGVDQLRLAPGELGDKGHAHLVIQQLGLQAVQMLLHRSIQQLVLPQPAAKLRQLVGKAFAPFAQLVKLLVKRWAHLWFS